MNKRLDVHWLAKAAIAFGAVTLFSGGAGPVRQPSGTHARPSVGNAVLIVLWFNFCAGFVYVLAGLGLLRRRPWAVYASIFLASSTALIAAAFGAYVMGGGAFEVRTVGAIAIRLLFWIVVSVASISAKKAPCETLVENTALTARSARLSSWQSEQRKSQP